MEFSFLTYNKPQKCRIEVLATVLHRPRRAGIDKSALRRLIFSPQDANRAQHDAIAGVGTVFLDKPPLLSEMR